MDFLMRDVSPGAHEISRFEAPQGAHEINRRVRDIERGHGTECHNHLEGDAPTRGGMGNLLLLLLSVLGDALED